MTNISAETHVIVDDFVAPACDGFIDILYQDADILLINKPSGLFSLTGKTHSIGIRYITVWCMDKKELPQHFLTQNYHIV